jgi:hypothetical protein
MSRIAVVGAVITEEDITRRDLLDTIQSLRPTHATDAIDRVLIEDTDTRTPPLSQWRTKEPSASGGIEDIDYTGSSSTIIAANDTEPIFRRDAPWDRPGLAEGGTGNPLLEDLVQDDDTVEGRVVVIAIITSQDKQTISPRLLASIVPRRVHQPPMTIAQHLLRVRVRKGMPAVGIHDQKKALVALRGMEELTVRTRPCHHRMDELSDVLDGHEAQDDLVEERQEVTGSGLWWVTNPLYSSLKDRALISDWESIAREVSRHLLMPKLQELLWATSAFEMSTDEGVDLFTQLSAVVTVSQVIDVEARLWSESRSKKSAALPFQNIQIEFVSRVQQRHDVLGCELYIFAINKISD